MIKSLLVFLFFIALGYNANAQLKKDGTPDMRYKANKEMYGNTYNTPIYTPPNTSSFGSMYNDSKPYNYNNGGQLRLQEGYQKSNGTWVSPHVKTTPDNNRWNNLNYGDDD